MTHHLPVEQNLTKFDVLNPHDLGSNCFKLNRPNLMKLLVNLNILFF